MRDGLISATPCVLDKGVLPKNVDKNPKWRGKAIYARDEMSLLLSDVRVPTSRRVLYAFKFLAALRHGEAAALTWEDYDATRKPLGCLTVACSYTDDGTKTGITRYVPAHPVLAALLAEWKLSGWERAMGRPPRPTDLITPTEQLTMRRNNYSRDLKLDLERLGLRSEGRSGHAMRATYITEIQADGGTRDIFKTYTHAPGEDVIDGYTRFSWPLLCEQMSKLKFRLQSRGEVIMLPKMTVGGDAEPQLGLVQDTNVEKTGCKPVASTDSPKNSIRISTRSHSSAGQSNGFLNRRSHVRVMLGSLRIVEVFDFYSKEKLH